jgi:hypothetical protein
MEINQKQDLAFLYIQGELSSNELPRVFQLMLEDEAFRQCLKQEIEFKNQLKNLQIVMEPTLKKQWFSQINESILQQTAPKKGKDFTEPAWLYWSEWTLKMTLPPIVYPFIKILQRRCLL